MTAEFTEIDSHKAAGATNNYQPGIHGIKSLFKKWVLNKKRACSACKRKQGCLRIESFGVRACLPDEEQEKGGVTGR